MNKCTFMGSLPIFKAYMTSSNAPNYVIRYCEDLDEQKWEWFYGQMKGAIEVVSDVGYMFYVLKWILKHDFDDLTYEIYFQDYMDPEMRPESLVEDEWVERLHEKYNERLMDELTWCARGGSHE